MKEPIKIWRFDDAPEQYRAMSEHGGDEDFIALVPSGYEDCAIDKYETPEGDVYIGAHA